MTERDFSEMTDDEIEESDEREELDRYSEADHVESVAREHEEAHRRGAVDARICQGLGCPFGDL